MDDQLYWSAPLFQHAEFAPHPAEIVWWCSLPVSTAAFAVLKILQPADYLFTPLHSASRLAWREVTERGQRFGNYPAIMAIKKLPHDARLLGRNFGRGLLGR